MIGVVIVTTLSKYIGRMYIITPKDPRWYKVEKIKNIFII